MEPTRHAARPQHALELNAVTLPAVEPLQHIDALLDGPLGSQFFIKLDLDRSHRQLAAVGAGADL